MDNGSFHSFDDETHTSVFSPLIIVIFFIFIVLGVGTGYVLAQNRMTKVDQKIAVSDTNSDSSITVGTTYGSDDTGTFKDTVEGQLAAGGIADEGQYHLVRPGGDNQNVYLTSSLVDLSKFIDHKVKVWGQTQKAQHAAWLMDVGRVEVEK